MRILVFACALLLSACAGAPPPQDAFYRLNTVPPTAFSRPPLPGVVEVNNFAAEGLASDRAILYSYADKPDQLLRYAYHFWVQAPPMLLQDQLVRTLRQTNAAGEVVTAELRVPPDYVIEGRVRRFEQIAGPTPSVVVEVEMGVVRMHGNRLLLLKSYRVEKPSASEQVPDAVHAFEAATGELFARFTSDLSQISAE